jgi:hypothetical protein
MTKLNWCPSRKQDFCSRSRPAKKITAGICVIFLGLFFEHNAEAGQKDHFWRTLTKEVKKNNAILTS